MTTTPITTIGPLSASGLARNTPDSRDRYVDFLRLASIVVVVLGHWLMAVVTWHGSEFRTGNVIGMVPGLWLATWLLQVMPIFFFVGGFANFASIEALRRKGKGGAEFVAGRVRRLLRPVAVLLAVWIPTAVVLQWAGVDPRVLRSATKLVCQPLWFLGAYLVVTALAPFMRHAHAHARTQTLVTLVSCTILVDVLRLGLGGIGYFNVLFVWLFAQQLGFFYADGTFGRMRRSRLVALALGALAALAALTTVPWYPRSMVGLPGDRYSNMSPPTLCLVVLAVFQVAIVMLCRPYAQRWLSRAKVWTAVVAGNGIIMTIFLWHLTAALIALAGLHAVGFPQPAGASALWWATRPAWIVCALLPLAALIAVFGRFERPRPAQDDAGRAHVPVAVGTGAALLAIAVLGVASSNLSDLIANEPVELAVVVVTPVKLLLAALAGSALVGWKVRRSAVA